MSLWTFINNYKDEIYIAQIHTQRIYSALEQYIDQELPKILTMTNTSPNAIETNRLQLAQSLAYSEIDELESVHKITFFDVKSPVRRSKDMKITIINTVGKSC